MSYKTESRVYVGNLPPDIRTKDIEDLFYKYGKITFVDLKNRRGPPFAFVEFEDPRQVFLTLLIHSVRVSAFRVANREHMLGLSEQLRIFLFVSVKTRPFGPMFTFS